MTGLYKDATRKKYHSKKPLINKAGKYAKQYQYARRRSIIYQNTMLHKFGAELTYLNSWQALHTSIQEFNDLYGDHMHYKHAVLLMLIKHYTTANSVPDFYPRELLAYYPDLKTLLGHYSINARSLGALVADLFNMHFINPLNDRYIISTRVKIFVAMFDKHLKAMFSDLL